MAKIEQVEILMVDLKPKVKRTDAIQSFVSQETPIVRIRTDDGAVGTGYSYTIGTGGHAVVSMLVAPPGAATDRAGPRHGRADLARPAVPHARDVRRRYHLAGTLRHRHGAVGPALPAQRQSRSIRRRAAPRTACRSTPPRAAGCTSTSAALVEDALRAKAAGFGGCKVKVGRRPQEDVARLPAVRDAVGPDFEIMVDANQAFAVDEAIRRARLYEAADLAWFEEPLPADDLGGHVRLSQATTLPIAVGESLYSLGHFREYLQREACSVVQVDVARIGGITPWLKTAHLAEAFNVPVCPHFLMELHVSLAAAVPNGRWVEYIPQLDDIVAGELVIRDGLAIPPETVGLGIAWDFEKIAGSARSACGFARAVPGLIGTF